MPGLSAPARQRQAIAAVRYSAGYRFVADAALMKLAIFSLILMVGTATAWASDDDFFRSLDPLAPRDDWGLLHQTRDVSAVDFAPRYHSRALYYFKASEQLTVQPAY